MRAICYYLLISGVLFISCGSNTKTQPPPIPEEQFILILTDLHVIDGTLQSLEITGDSLQHFARYNYEKVLKKHNLTYKQFEEALYYFEAEPDKMDKMYEKVVNELSKRQADLGGKPIEKD